MKLSITRIADRGIADSERLHLKVISDANLTYYAVLNTRYLTPTSLASGAVQAYWFSGTPVKAGDTVILYTRNGTPSQQKAGDGTTNYFRFWGSTHPLWSQTGNCAVLVELNSWQTSVYE